MWLISWMQNDKQQWRLLVAGYNYNLLNINQKISISLHGGENINATEMLSFTNNY